MRSNQSFDGRVRPQMIHFVPNSVKLNRPGRKRVSQRQPDGETPSSTPPGPSLQHTRSARQRSHPDASRQETNGARCRRNVLSFAYARINSLSQGFSKQEPKVGGRPCCACSGCCYLAKIPILIMSPFAKRLTAGTSLVKPDSTRPTEVDVTTTSISVPPLTITICVPTGI